MAMIRCQQWLQQQPWQQRLGRCRLPMHLHQQQVLRQDSSMASARGQAVSSSHLGLPSGATLTQQAEPQTRGGSSA